MQQSVALGLNWAAHPSQVGQQRPPASSPACQQQYSPTLVSTLALANRIKLLPAALHCWVSATPTSSGQTAARPRALCPGNTHRQTPPHGLASQLHEACREQLLHTQVGKRNRSSLGVIRAHRAWERPNGDAHGKFMAAFDASTCCTGPACSRAHGRIKICYAPKTSAKQAAAATIPYALHGAAQKLHVGPVLSLGQDRTQPICCHVNNACSP